MFRLLRIIIFTVLMYIVSHIFVFLVLPFGILISYMSKESIPILKQWFVRSLFAIVGKKLKVSGYENVDPDQAYLIVSNYPSFYAGFSLIGMFPEASIVVHAFIKKVPLLGQILNRLGTIYVQPGRAGKGKRAIDLHLNMSDIINSLVILPEGARTPDGKIHRFRRGFLYILRQTNLDLPLVCSGSDDIAATQQV